MEITPGVTEIDLEPMGEPSVNAAVLARQRERKYERVKTNAILNIHLSKGKRDRYLFVGLITGIYCIAEIAVAIALDSLALLSDGFHNLGDLAAILLAWWCEANKSKRTGIAYSYGYKRAEVLGGLANACSLVSLSFYIVLESIPRFWRHAEIQSGGSFIAIAAIGLAINTVGTIVFACNGMEPGAGFEEQKESGSSPYAYKEISVSISSSSNPDATADYVSAPAGPPMKHESSEPALTVTEEDMDLRVPTSARRSKSQGKKQDKDEKYPDEEPKSDLNMRAMFIHYLGDSISSCTVLLEGVLLMVGANSGSWVNYVDPVFSLIIVSIIVVTTIPLIKECTQLLLQVCPPHLDTETIYHQLKKVPGVLGIHDLHIWAITPGLIVSSLHFNCLHNADIKGIVGSMKGILHKQGIHSSAIQPEYIEIAPSSPYTIVYKCEENCIEACEKEWCCYNDHDYL